MTDVNLLFRQAFEYSILEIAPKKFAQYVYNTTSLSDHTFPIKKEVFNKMRSVLIDQMTFDLEKNKELLVNSKALSKLNLDVLDTFAGKTVLHSAGKNLGLQIGKTVQEIDFRRYILEINNLIEKWNAGKIRIKKFDQSSIDFVLIDNIFSKNIRQNRTICYFMSGFFQGILEDYTNTYWNVIETKCSAKGDEYCEFQARNI